MTKNDRDSIRNAYTTLGVSALSTDAQIKKAYRMLSLKYHPDRNQGNPEAEERFKVLSSAYALLMSAEGRDSRRIDRIFYEGNPYDNNGGDGIGSLVDLVV